MSSFSGVARGALTGHGLGFIAGPVAPFFGLATSLFGGSKDPKLFKLGSPQLNARSAAFNRAGLGDGMGFFGLPFRGFADPNFRSARLLTAIASSKEDVGEGIQFLDDRGLLPPGAGADIASGAALTERANAANAVIAGKNVSVSLKPTTQAALNKYGGTDTSFDQLLGTGGPSPDEDFAPSGSPSTFGTDFFGVDGFGLDVGPLSFGAPAGVGSPAVASAAAPGPAGSISPLLILGGFALVGLLLVTR